MIHTDFEKGFIRAEVIAYDDFIACKGEQGAKEAGKMRLEGKEYVVQGRRRHAFPVQRLKTVRRRSPALALRLVACASTRPRDRAADRAHR